MAEELLALQAQIDSVRAQRGKIAAPACTDSGQTGWTLAAPRCYRLRARSSGHGATVCALLVVAGAGSHFAAAAVLLSHLLCILIIINVDRVIVAKSLRFPFALVAGAGQASIACQGTIRLGSTSAERPTARY